MVARRSSASIPRCSLLALAVLGSAWGTARAAAGADATATALAGARASFRAAPPPTVTRAPGVSDGAATGQDLFLEVFHGERPSGLIAHFRLLDGVLWATADELEAIGLVVPPAAERDGDGWVPLDALPGLGYRYEEAEQRLVLHAPALLRPEQRLGYERPEAAAVRRDRGWLVAYDAYGRALEETTSGAVAASLRRFGRVGSFEVTGIGRVGDAATELRRLETRWTYSDPESLSTWSAGDLISGGLSWTRPVRLGGVRWRRNFGIRPDLITIPMPRFSGAATVPSTVELYVDNVRQFNAEVDGGPFVLDTLPRIEGAGLASLLVTDVLGRVTRTTVPFYVDHRRLAPGLTDFSLELGLLRHDYGAEDDGYGDNLVASGSLRRGLTDSFTLEAHAEGGPDLALAGLGAVWSPAARWGVVSGSWARSEGNGGGHQHTLGYQWNSARYGFDLQSRRRSGDYRDLGDLAPGVPVALFGVRAEDRATVWLPVGRGSVAVSWIGSRGADLTTHRTRSLSWTQNLGARLSVSMTAFDDDESGRGGRLSVSVPLGDDIAAGLGVESGDSGSSSSLSLRRGAPYGGGWGWSLQADDRSEGHGQAGGELRGNRGEVRFGVDWREGGTGAYVDAGGSLAVMNGWLFASRRIPDAFAVVSTGGVSDVLVLSENRPYGRTGRHGYLLIPELRGWERNRLAIDPDALAANVRVGALEHVVTPADGSGVLVPFEVAEVISAVVVLLGPGGDPVPAGSRARLAGTDREILVGYGGEAYVEDLTAERLIHVEMSSSRCRYRIPAFGHTSGAPRTALRVHAQPVSCERLGP